MERHVDRRVRRAVPAQHVPHAFLDRLEIDPAAQVATLSGGEKKRAALALAFATDPGLLLLDEPSMGLAPVLVREIFQTLRQINAAGTTILLVEQNALMALSIANRAYVLQTGEIVLHDQAEKLQKNEMIQKAYLGME